MPEPDSPKTEEEREEESNDEFLDDSWEPVPLQHIRAVAPVRATISVATPQICDSTSGGVP